MKSVYRIQSTCTLKNGETVESDDYVAVDGGMITAANRVSAHLMGFRFRDSRGEWSDVVKVKPHHGTPVCELTVK